jgi:hypothetical protein
MVRQHQTRNLEIPRCAIAHLRFDAFASPRNDNKIRHAGSSYPTADSISMVFRTAGRAIMRA